MDPPPCMGAALQGMQPCQEEWLILPVNCTCMPTHLPSPHALYAFCIRPCPTIDAPTSARPLPLCPGPLTWKLHHVTRGGVIAQYGALEVQSFTDFPSGGSCARSGGLMLFGLRAQDS